MLEKEKIFGTKVGINFNKSPYDSGYHYKGSTLPLTSEKPPKEETTPPQPEDPPDFENLSETPPGPITHADITHTKMGLDD